MRTNGVWRGVGLLAAVTLVFGVGCKKGSGSSSSKDDGSEKAAGTANGVSATLTAQIELLATASKDEFTSLRDESTKEEMTGDFNYGVKGAFNACGPRSSYNKIWHWKSIDNNWEYVCDVSYDNEAAAKPYWDEMVKTLTAIGAYTWEPVKPGTRGTKHRLEGVRADPPTRIVLDFDVDSAGAVEIELWFKQHTSGAASALPDGSPARPTSTPSPSSAGPSPPSPSGYGRRSSSQP